MDEIWYRAIDSLNAFGTSSQRTYFLYLIGAAILAYGAFMFGSNRAMITGEKDAPRSFKNFLKYLFDKDVFLHKSSQQDYAYFITNAFIHYGIISVYILSTPLFVFATLAIFSKYGGAHEGALVAASNYQMIVLSLVFAVLYDFGAFFAHYLMHKFPILWAFHKVHHSAERLNPFTLFRMHPVDLILTGIIIAILTGIGMGTMIYIWHVEVAYKELLGINFVFFLYYLFGYNLRHSHVWLPYPKWLSYILLSPAQHQIHHSIERKHWDKNLGLIFAFWDHLFKTLYIPKKDEEKFAYGVSKDEPNPYNSVISMYLKPCAEAWEIFAKGLSRKRAIFHLILLVGIGGFIYNIFLITGNNMKAIQSIPQTVFIEDLTWSEVNAAMDRGYDRIIIPTGGTEQNGRHVILGKHNYVVKESAERIAKQVGKTLVAPVMAYVPEEVHMSFPGTVSVSEEHFAAILEDAARSFQRHGFKYIFFVGDSSHNQKPQQDVAEKLNLEWFGEGAIVASISDYYSDNGQIKWLLEQGFTMEQIGGHAGIRDTSEMLVANDEGFRSYRITPKGFDTIDHSGDYKRANKKIGEKMFELKTEAAVRQINTVLNETE
ncbi:MAG: creatininase family protein [Pseudomonadota bacterium]|nr:creatininase family protein [Pseudomonadota bacterium]MED5424061.1 creatininase family protein [Pseudomonadota bacterium]